MKEEFNGASGRENEADRYDPVSLMFKERVILAFGEVNQQMAYNIVAQLKKLEFMDKDAPITILIDSPGGSVTAGMAIYDMMREVSCPITTVGIGMQASMGSILLAGGDKRMMARNAKLMIHSIGSGTQGKQADQEISLDSARRLFEDLKAVYIRHIGLTSEFWDLCCAKDTWFSAEQALKMGFISEIIESQSTAKLAPYEQSAKKYAQGNQERRDERVPESVEKIKDLLQATSAASGEGERLRPELLVALSQLSKYWTTELRAKKQAETKVAAANDDVAAPAAKKTAGNGMRPA